MPTEVFILSTRCPECNQRGLPARVVRRREDGTPVARWCLVCEIDILGDLKMEAILRLETYRARNFQPTEHELSIGCTEQALRDEQANIDQLENRRRDLRELLARHAPCMLCHEEFSTNDALGTCDDCEHFLQNTRVVGSVLDDSDSEAAVRASNRTVNG